MKAKFFRCPKCGNVIVKLVDSNVIPSCCGEPMQILVPQTSHEKQDCEEKSCTTVSSQGKHEYHEPVVEHLNTCVTRVCVGKDPHPMSKEHNICFIAVETKRGGEVRILKNGEEPCALFNLDDTPCAYYAYCNIHGLWMTKAEKCES